MRSTVVTRVSAIVLALAGIALLFAPVEILARLAPGTPMALAWIVQLLAGAWLGLSAMNWMTRFTMVGGVYGRAIVLANATTYFVSAMTMLHALRDGAPTATVVALTVVAVALAAVYGYLLFRGPFVADRTPTAAG